MDFDSSENNGRFAVLDLCCGMGGLSHGFVKNDFDVTGVDISQEAGLTYALNKLGKFQPRNLMRRGVSGHYSIVVGGPPCEPWSCLNLRKRKDKHPRYKCLNAFFRELHKIQPFVFVMENVPAIRKDPMLTKNLRKIQKQYDAVSQVLNYSEYGAALARNRFFMIGVKKETEIAPSDILKMLKKRKPKTVRDAILDLRNKEWDSTTDHVWPKVKTIHKYLENYLTGKYGWRILDWDYPSPSFGNITKTYILHPDSFENGNDARPISVREALRIIGFPDDYRFPDCLSMRTKYEMIADAVSPIFSFGLARAIKAAFCSESKN